MYRGVIYLTLSAFIFSLATVFVKLITAGTDIPAIELSFFRFLFGFLAVLIPVLYSGMSMKPNKGKYVYLRAFFNTVAVILFFYGIEYSNVSKANLLNMTYPVFVFLIAPFINGEKSTPEYILYLLMTLAGIYFVIIPSGSSTDITSVNGGDIAALASGITAGFAITTLREARKDNPTYIILLYLMGFGTCLSATAAIPLFVMPRGIYIIYTLLMALFSFLGQIFITAGFKHIDAAPGAIVSASRIIFAIILGVIIFSDSITGRMVWGSVLIFISLAGVSGIFTYIRQNLLYSA